MSESTTQSLPTTRRLSGRARAGILGGVGLAAAVAATLVISGTAGATAADEPHKPSSMVEEGSGASDATGPAEGAVPTDLDTVAPGYGADALVEKDVVTDGAAGPSSMVAESSGASDAAGHTDPATGVTVIDGDMLIAPRAASL